MWISVIIPTKDRQNELDTLLSSLGTQERLPDQVIVVAAGDVPDAADLGRRFDNLPLRIERARVQGLTHQRNQCAASLDPRCDWVVSLDDDIELSPDCLQQLERVAAAQPRVIGGIGLNIINEPRARHRKIKIWFGMDHPQPGKLLPSSFNTLICPLEDGELLDVDWLHGGATAWRAEVVTSFPWAEQFSGYALAEDVEYSARVATRYRFVAAGSCRVEHHHAAGRRARGWQFGAAQIRNRQFIVEQHPDRLSMQALRHAAVGQFLSNLTRGTLERDPYLWQVAAGNAVALARLALKRSRRERWL